MKDLSRGLEALIAVLLGVLGAPIVAAAWWAVLNSPICSTALGTVDCVVTPSGEHWSWTSLAASPEALALAVILAGAAFLALEGLNDRSAGAT